MLTNEFFTQNWNLINKKALTFARGNEEIAADAIALAWIYLRGRPQVTLDTYLVNVWSRAMSLIKQRYLQPQRFASACELDLNTVSHETPEASLLNAEKHKLGLLFLHKSIKNLPFCERRQVEMFLAGEKTYQRAKITKFGKYLRQKWERAYA